MIKRFCTITEKEVDYADCIVCNIHNVATSGPCPNIEVEEPDIDTALYDDFNI